MSEHNQANAPLFVLIQLAGGSLTMAELIGKYEHPIHQDYIRLMSQGLADREAVDRYLITEAVRYLTDQGVVKEFNGQLYSNWEAEELLREGAVVRLRELMHANPVSFVPKPSLGEMVARSHGAKRQFLEMVERKIRTDGPEFDLSIDEVPPLLKVKDRPIRSLRGIDGMDVALVGNGLYHIRYSV